METYSAEEAKKELERLIEEVKPERDEMFVKAHLLKADAKDEWEKVEKNWEHFRSKANLVGKEAKDASGDVAAAAKLLGEELMNSMKRIKRSL